jgi:hypothetical protein
MDSANRRLTIPQAFLALDAILILYQNIAEGLVVYPKVIAKNLNEELPFMATESFLMAGVAAGGDRQDLHERIRQASVAAAAEIKQHGRPNDLITRLKNDSAFAKVDLEAALDPSQFTGRAAKQVDEFLAEVVAPNPKTLQQSAQPRSRSAGINIRLATTRSGAFRFKTSVTIHVIIRLGKDLSRSFVSPARIS